MAMGRRKRERQAEFWVATDALPPAPGHSFYSKLNELLAERGFDEFVEGLCAKFYHESLGRPGIPPGVYIRMLLIGYFECIDFERGIAWRCADSLGLRSFLGYSLTEGTPDHSRLSAIRNRIDVETHREIFTWVLATPADKRDKALLRKRGELVERPFAHCYETGGMRRTHPRGHPNILKRLLIHIAGFNLGLLMRTVTGIGKPRRIQDGLGALPGCALRVLGPLRKALRGLVRPEIALWAFPARMAPIPARLRAA